MIVKRGNAKQSCLFEYIGFYALRYEFIIKGLKLVALIFLHASSPPSPLLCFQKKKSLKYPTISHILFLFYFLP